MKKILQILGTLIYSVIASYLLWLLFLWAIPFVMDVGWAWLLLYLMFVGGFITVCLTLMNSIVGIILIPLTRNNIVSKIINIFPFVFHGYSAIRVVWTLDMEYGFLQWILGVASTITIAISFISLILLPFSYINKE
ncbi:MAG: hypothetical protein J6J23_03775 [Clostridia bacterium]|nr:hypothetical protein [Clostridia bacterium]